MGNLLVIMKMCTSVGEEPKTSTIFLDFEGNNVGIDNRDSGSYEVNNKIINLLSTLEEVNSFLRSYLDPLVINQNENSAATNENEKSIPVLKIDASNIDDMKEKIQWVKRCMTLNDEIGELMPQILQQIKNSNPPFREDNEYLILFGRILDLAMQFDHLKLAASSIQNIIGVMNRHVVTNPTLKSELKGEGIDLQDLAAFYIKTAPMLQTIINAASHFFKNPEQNVPLDMIINYCKICMGILTSEHRSKIQNTVTIGLVLRAMVATALLYDHLSDVGMFVKNSPIDVKKIVKILEAESGGARGRAASIGQKKTGIKRESVQEVEIQARNLLSVLKYSNKHLKDKSSQSIQNLFSRIY